ncbi:DotD/TraH family lipoprotein [Azospirillum canadense]|uniref:DotD/TraH family lipoprotein n=1 Tax=Azospirillum canadense TaxID=403962 RepID=UPI0022268486|nr:DotD/TraH family lipoprotein [Azospirillum canadense]MCW2240347.1 hypothetical protein [Azospirillum canadense]
MRRLAPAALTTAASRTAALLASALLAACITTAPPPSNEPTLVELRLSESSQRIAAAWEQIARAQAATAPRAPAPIDLSLVPDELRRPITWPAWSGPIDAAVRGLAARINYRVLVHGVPPATMPLVTIDANATPAVHVLESIGLQLGAHGTVRPDPNDPPTIHLYFNPPKSGVL